MDRLYKLLLKFAINIHIPQCCQVPNLLGKRTIKFVGIKASAEQICFYGSKVSNIYGNENNITLIFLL